MGGEQRTTGLPAGLAAITSISAILLAFASGAARSADDWHYDARGRAQVDIQYDCTQGAPAQALSSLGFVTGTSVELAPVCVIEGWIPANSLRTIASIP